MMTLTNSDCALSKEVEGGGGGGEDFFRKQFEEENAGIIAVINNFADGRDNFLDDQSLSTLEAILDGEGELSEWQNLQQDLAPEGGSDFIELNNVCLQNPLGATVPVSDIPVISTTTVVSNNVTTSLSSSAASEVLSLPPGTDFVGQSSTTIATNSFSETISASPSTPSTTIVPSNASSETREEEYTPRVSSEESDEDPNATVAITPGDLECSFNKRSCKIVLTRCDTGNTDGGITRWKLKSNFVDERDSAQGVHGEESYSQQYPYNSEFPTTDWSKETDEEFVSSLLRIPQTNSSEFLSNPIISEEKNGSTEPSQAGKRSNTTAGVPSAEKVKQRMKRDKLVKMMHQSRDADMEERKRSLMEQNKLIRVVAGGFQCVPCGKKFENRWNLVVHIRVHTNERPYRCPECTLTFRQLAHAQKHARKIHKREVYRYEVEIGSSESNFQPTIEGKRTKKLGRPRKYPPGMNPNQRPKPQPETDQTPTLTIDTLTHTLMMKMKDVSIPAKALSERKGEVKTLAPPSREEASIVNSVVSNNGCEDDMVPDFLKNCDMDNQLPSKGCIRIMHPDTESMVEVQGDLLMQFLRPFLDKDQNPPKDSTGVENENSPRESKCEASFEEVQSKLRTILRTEIGEEVVGVGEKRKRGAPKGMRKKMYAQSRHSVDSQGDSGSDDDDAIVGEGPKMRYYRCKTCDAKYPNIAHLRIHMRSHLTNGKAKPHSGGMSQPGTILSSLLKSTTKVLGADSKNEGKRKGKFKCVRCNNYYANVYNLHRHKMNSCPFRGKVSNKKPPIQQKVKTEPEVVEATTVTNPAESTEVAAKIVQEVKPDTSSDASMSDEDLTIPETPSEFKHKCDKCGAAYKRNSDLLYHVRSKHGNDKEKSKPKLRFKCEFCEASFATKAEREKHVTASHADEGSTKVQDTNSNSSMDSKSSVGKVQGQGQEKKERWTCDFCFKSYCRKDVLNNHRKIHTNERPYACSLCPEAFIRPYSLQAHMRRHLGDKPFKCDQPGCKTAFYKSISIKNHMAKVHGIL